MLLCRLFLFGNLLRLPSHLHQGINKIIDGFALLRLAPHPHQRIQQIINGRLFFRHAAFYVWGGPFGYPYGKYCTFPS